ncbi:unnamed protein product [Soboliphyme baturini]|uniref:SSD domain-containing protein n=1 Tax=Soboliphyme baturini TaxID=241478 RepID=A0A183IZ78_9BILA|nr:unnamed protein product [Soboliphyme baturini]
MTQHRYNSESGCYLDLMFLHYGELVGTYPWFFLIAPIVLTVILCFGVFRMKVVDDMRELYSPPGSPSIEEHRIVSAFSAQNNSDNSALFIIITQQNRGDLMTRSNIDIITSINNHILNNLTIDLDGKRQNFAEAYCAKMSRCGESNQAIQLLADVFFNPKYMSRSDVNISYPVSKVFDNYIYLGGTLGGVELVHLIYTYPTYGLKGVETAFEMSVEEYLREVKSEHENLEFDLFSSNILKNEVARTTLYALPYFPISIGLIGLSNSLFSIGASIGLMCLIGVPYNNTVTVVPFITLALAVDDSFIMLAAWQHTDMKLSPRKRMGLTLKESGAAITMTFLTDVFAFIIGAFSSTPAISAFSYYTVGSLVFDYLYQLTFFCGATVLGGVREANKRHSILFWLPTCEKTRNISPVHYHLRKLFPKLLTYLPSKCIIMLIYVVYLAFSFYGCCIIDIDLRPSHLLVKSSPLQQYIALAEKYVFAQGFIATVYVQKTPDLRNETQITQFMTFVHELESTPFSVGKMSTALWLNEFLNYLSFLETDVSETFLYLNDFFEMSSNFHWQSCVFRDGEDGNVSKFCFMTGFKVAEWRERADMVQAWRRVLAKYPQYEAVVYEEYNFLADQILTIKSTTLQEVGIAFICMCLVCAFFMQKLDIFFWVLWSLFSMDMGVIGLLSWSGINLDPTVIVSILMSIGLTIDFTVHIGYHYYKIGVNGNYHKLLELFDVAGWPLIEGGICTLLAMIALLFVPCYVTSVFFRTIFFVVAIGLFHGLIILPILFSFTLQRYKHE